MEFNQTSFRTIKTPLFAAALTRPYCCLLKVWGERIFYGHKMDIYISCLMSSLAHSSKPPPTGTFQTLFEHKLIKYQHSWGLKFLCRNSISIWAQQFNWWERISIKQGQVCKISTFKLVLYMKYWFQFVLLTTSTHIFNWMITWRMILIYGWLNLLFTLRACDKWNLKNKIWVIIGKSSNKNNQ